jgi:hypothetical protein
MCTCLEPTPQGQNLEKATPPRLSPSTVTHTTTTQFKIMSLSSIHTHPALSVLVAALALVAAGVVAYRYSSRAPRTSRRNGDFTAAERWKNGPWAVGERDMKASPRVSELWVYPIKV